MTYHQFRSTLAIAVRSHNALASPATAIVGLGVVPLMQTLLVVAVVGAAGGQNLGVTAQATILVGTITFVAASVGAQTAMDRVTGVAAQILPYGLLRPQMFVGKLVVAMGLSVPAALLQVAGVALTGTNVWLALSLLPAALLTGAVLGVAIGLWALASKDPFALPNLVPFLLPITSGAAVPLATYPALLQPLCAVIPGAGLAKAVRGDIPPLIGVGWDLATGGVWLALTLSRATAISKRARDGVISSDVF